VIHSVAAKLLAQNEVKVETIIAIGIDEVPATSAEPKGGIKIRRK
jgi:hypothetical protein